MRKILSISIIALLAGVTVADAQSRNSGPPYGRGYMRCINSGHPADFCQNVSKDFRG
jgi:hypothetical protein